MSKSRRDVAEWLRKVPPAVAPPRLFGLPLWAYVIAGVAVVAALALR